MVVVVVVVVTVDVDVDVVVDGDVNVDLDDPTLTNRTSSVVGNFSRDRAKKIARGEAMECAASLDVMKLRRLVAPRRYEDGIRLLEGVFGMLTKMV